MGVQHEQHVEDYLFVSGVVWFFFLPARGCSFYPAELLVLSFRKVS